MPALTQPQPPTLGAVHLANFKAFGEHLQKIPLRPITLVFGKNSSGKSSLVHALLWLHHMICRDEIDVLSPVASHGTVDLGGFQQFRFCQQSDREVQVELALGSIIDDLGVVLFENLTLRLAYGTTPKKQDPLARLSQLVAAIIQSSMERGVGLRIQSLPARQLVLKAVRESLLKIADETEVPIYTQERIQEALDGAWDWDGWIDKAFERCCPYAHQLENQWLQDLVEMGEEHRLREDRPQTPIQFNRLQEEGVCLATALWNEESPRLKQADQLKPRLLRFALLDKGSPVIAAEESHTSSLEVTSLNDTHTSFAGLRGTTPEKQCLIRLQNSGWLPRHLEAEAGHAIDEHGKVIEDLLERVRSAARMAVDNLQYLGPLRTYPNRNLMAGDLDPSVHDQADWLKVIHNPALREKVNAWLKQLGSHHELQVDAAVSVRGISDAFKQAMGDEVRKYRAEIEALKKEEERTGNGHAWAYSSIELWDYQEAIVKAAQNAAKTLESPGSQTLHLKDRRTGADVSFRDVGLGTSQMLPIVISALSNRNKLIAIEQPEIHLHPALQAELGDLFIESAMGENGNHFILETHSEHLILRLLRRIRETKRNKLPEGKRALRAEDVSILYIAPDEQGSRVQVMNVNEHGKLTNNWPEGFFEERLAELF